MRAVSGVVSRVEGSTAYVSLGQGYEVSAAMVGPVPLAAGQRVLLVEYDRPDTFAAVGTLPPAVAPPAGGL